MPITLRLWPTDGRECLRHITGFTRLVGTRLSKGIVHVNLKVNCATMPAKPWQLYCLTSGNAACYRFDEGN